MNISFKLGGREHTEILSKFFSQRNLNYRGYNSWLLRAIEEYRYEIKRAILGFYEDVLVSALMFQNCKHMSGFTELKSGRTIEEFSRRLFLSFEARQVETISRQEGKLGIICDVRTGRPDVLSLLKKDGYCEVERADLYGEGYEDIVMMKSLTKNLIY